MKESIKRFILDWVKRKKRGLINELFEISRKSHKSKLIITENEKLILKKIKNELKNSHIYYKESTYGDNCQRTLRKYYKLRYEKHRIYRGLQEINNLAVLASINKNELIFLSREKAQKRLNFINEQLSYDFGIFINIKNIVFYKKSKLAVIAHEFGHIITQHKLIQRQIRKVSNKFLKDFYGLSKTPFRLFKSLLSFFVLIEEKNASKNGIKLLEHYGADRELLNRAQKQYNIAYKTYKISYKKLILNSIERIIK